MLGDLNSYKTARLCLQLAISSNWQSYAWLSLYKQIVNYLQENNKNDIKTMSMVNLTGKDLVAIT